MGEGQRRKEKREAHKTAVHVQRIEAKKRRNRKLLINWGIVVVAVLLIFFSVSALGNRPAKYTDFAACIAESGATMYGADWCNHCQTQKRLFGRAFKKVSYENCDL